MTEHLAKLIATELNGTAHHTGGNLWVVRFARPEGSIVVLSDHGVAVYADARAMDDGNEKTWVDFTTE